MIIDERQKILAKNLVNYSCRCQKGDKFWIDAFDIDRNFTIAVARAVFEAGGMPFVVIHDVRVDKALVEGSTDELIEYMAAKDSKMMGEMQAYIGIRGGNNSCETSDVPTDRMQSLMLNYGLPVHLQQRVAKTKWVVLRYPNESMAQLAGMGTEAFEDFYFKVCNLDYSIMDKAMDPLVDLINKTDKVHIIAEDTDLSFSIKGIGAVKCSGHCNIPDGEVYTAPVADSVNGHIHYNVPSIQNGYKYENVRLTFKDGKIVDVSANNTAGANNIFDTDEGARFVGEFAFGVNPHIKDAMGDILFDEKISGSIHFTPGNCYADADNGNFSSVHWDLVQVQTPEFGGGEIYFDDVLIRKDGRFVLKQLEGLNPENLI